MCWMPVLNTGLRVSRQLPQGNSAPSLTPSCSNAQCPNDSAMIRPSKNGWILAERYPTDATYALTSGIESCNRNQHTLVYNRQNGDKPNKNKRTTNQPKTCIPYSYSSTMRCAVHISWISLKMLSDGRSLNCTRLLALLDFVVEFPDDVTKQMKYTCVFHLSRWKWRSSTILLTMDCLFGRKLLSETCWLIIHGTVENTFEWNGIKCNNSHSGAGIWKYHAQWWPFFSVTTR